MRVDRDWYKLNNSKKRTGKIFSRILAVVLVFVFCISLMPYSADSAYAETRGKYIFPTDTDSTTAGTSFWDPSGLQMEIYNPNGYNYAEFDGTGRNIMLSPRKAPKYSAGFATSVNKYNIAQNDFEITFTFKHPYNGDVWQLDNDAGMAFVFHTDPYHTLQSYSGTGALGIYGANTPAGSPSPQYSLLDNALAVELDFVAFKTYPDVGASRLNFDTAPLTPTVTTLNRYGHLAITRPGIADSGTQSIHHYVRQDIDGSYPIYGRVAENNTINITWMLTGPDTYTLTSKYYRNSTTATGTPTMTISQTFTYDQAFGPGGLFGGTEEVYLGFSAGREFKNSSADMSVNLVDRTAYNLYHVIGNQLPWPAATDPRMLASEKRYALLNSKLNFTDRKKTFNDYIFDKAYMADGTLISDISSVNFTTSGQRYYMTYVKKIIEDPTTPNPPEGYRRIIFDPTADGKITDSGTPGTPKVFDVHGTLTWGEVWTAIQSKISAIYKDEAKAFKGWTPVLPTDNATVISSIPPDATGGSTTTFTAVYKDRIIESPSATQLDDQDYVIIRFDANDRNNGAADEVVRGRLSSKMQGSTVVDQEVITYAVRKDTRWNYFASVAATPTLELKSPYWLFDKGSGNIYLQSSWQDGRDWTGATSMIPAYDSDVPVESIFAGTSEREKTYYAQYTENIPMGVTTKTGEPALWAVSLGLLLLGITLISGLLRKKRKHEGF